MKSITLPKVNKDTLLSNYLALFCFPKKQFAKMAKSGIIKIDGNIISSDVIVTPNEVISLDIVEECNIKPTDGPIKIVYEDDYLLIIDKLNNLDTMASKRHYLDNLSGRVVKYYNKIGLESTLHFVTRIDKSTKGLVLIAKYGFVHNILQNSAILKKYLALLQGEIKPLEDMVVIHIAKSLDGIKRCVNHKGKEAKTHYRVLKYVDGNSLVDIDLLTGRTHQIRVTFSYLNHPVVNDELYGDSVVDDLKLVCNSLSFIHPISKKKIEVNIETTF